LLPSQHCKFAQLCPALAGIYHKKCHVDIEAHRRGDVLPQRRCGINNAGMEMLPFRRGLGENDMSAK
jgi:hypothetical protein